ncbi:MAG: twin-arginine translocase TatA/TatE family subunit [Sphingobacteriales bacterium]|nr:MAG: twin-arginine translocase TatA/TatE family subunit [Sphingobacteriales bacterium]
MTSNVLLFLNLGTEEVILIVFVALLLFGGKKLPELAKGLGKGIREFKDASDSVKREIHKNINQLTAEEELEREELLLEAEKNRLRDYNPSNIKMDEVINSEENTNKTI